MDHIRSFSNQNQIRMQFNVECDYTRPKLSYRKCASTTNRNIYSGNRAVGLVYKTTIAYMLWLLGKKQK